MGEGPAPGFFGWACKGLGTFYRGKRFCHRVYRAFGGPLKGSWLFCGACKGLLGGAFKAVKKY